MLVRHSSLRYLVGAYLVSLVSVAVNSCLKPCLHELQSLSTSARPLSVASASAILSAQVVSVSLEEVEVKNVALGQTIRFDPWWGGEVNAAKLISLAPPV